MKLIAILLLAAALLGSGCTQSLVYSPSINLPADPMRKEQVQVIGGLGLFPETRPTAIDRSIDFGGDLTLRYAFSDRTVLGVKTWADLSELVDDYYRGGVSVEGLFLLSDRDAEYAYGLMPRTAALFAGSSIEASGASVSIITWLPKLGVFSPYGALGPAFGYHDLKRDDQGRSQWGYGAIANIGTAIELAEGLSLDVEAAGIVQFNLFDDRTDWILSPSLALSWTF